jgi:hypothetical protein
MDEGTTRIVQLKGHNYFVVDQDLTKGDRRSDGPALSNFFVTEAGSTTVNNVRQSHRIKNRIEEVPNGNAVSHEDSTNDGLLEVAQDATMYNLGCDEERARKKKRQCRRRQLNGDGVDSSHTLRPPKFGIRCAGRSDTTRLLWLNEFYVVYEGTRRKGRNYIYQAVQFLSGEHVPVGEVANMTDKMRRSIWVQGICHLPAEHVRKFSRRNKGYMFHTELNDSDARTALFGTCPEIVRVDNWLKWHQMRNVLMEVPRVVHADDVQTRRVHVAGRDNHYVCGVIATFDYLTQNFALLRLPRSGFCTYPEERLGMELNSASSMWGHIDDVFHKLRVCMSSGRQGTSSGTFSMPLLCTVYDFWQVRTMGYRIYLRCVKRNTDALPHIRS